MTAEHRDVAGSSGGARVAAIASARLPLEEHRSVLQQRAATLARVARTEDKADRQPAIRFSLGGEHWAVAASVVRQIIVLRELTPLPGATPPLFGVTEWRGDVLVLLDLRAELGVQVHGLTDLSRVIVVEGGEHAFGVLVDAASDVVELDPARIQPLPDSAHRLVSGVLDDGTVVLDGARLVALYGSGSMESETGGG